MYHQHSGKENPTQRQTSKPEQQAIHIHHGHTDCHSIHIKSGSVRKKWRGYKGALESNRTLPYVSSLGACGEWICTRAATTRIACELTALDVEFSDMRAEGWRDCPRKQSVVKIQFCQLCQEPDLTWNLWFQIFEPETQECQLRQESDLAWNCWRQQILFQSQEIQLCQQANLTWNCWTQFTVEDVQTSQLRQGPDVRWNCGSCEWVAIISIKWECRLAHRQGC